MHPNEQHDRHWSALCRLAPAPPCRRPLRLSAGLLLVRAGLKVAPVTVDDVLRMRPRERCLTARG